MSRLPLRRRMLVAWTAGLMALTFLLGAAGAVQYLALRRVTAVPRPGRIDVQAASFGENCNPQLHDNVLDTVRRVCNSEKSCRFAYDVRRLGDPAGGCLKEFRVSYSCGVGELRELLFLFDRARMAVAFNCAAAR